MIRPLAVLICIAPVFASPMTAFAADADAEMTKILVTFADPGMSNATRAGPPGPGYRRRSSNYLTSVGVKRAANRIADEFNLQELDEWPIISLKVHCLVYGVATGETVEDLLHRLRQRPEVESAQRLNEFEVNGTSAGEYPDPYTNLQHNLDTLELVQAHRWSLGDGTKVTIIDTGADLAHPELRSQITDHQDFVGSGANDFSTDAHGTAVAGVIAAAANNGVGLIGVAPSTRLTILKACWYADDKTTAVCNSFTLAKALSYAIDSDTDIVNLSLGGPSDELLGRLLQKVIERGILVVVAAPAHTPTGFPAEVPGVIVVTSSDADDRQQFDDRFFISAPGSDILVPVPLGGYDFSSGRSLSAAHVSGVVALLIARQPRLTSQRASTLLADSQQSASASVNACRALAALLQKSGCRIPEALSQRQ